MKKETYTIDGFTFEEGKSYKMKYKRTVVYYLWEELFGFYRSEFVTAKNHDYEGYIMTKQLPERYSWHKGKNKNFTCMEVTGSELKELNAKYRTYEVIQEEAQAKKWRKYKK